MATGRIGTTPVLQVRWSKAPTNGTTSLSGLDDNSVSLVYSVGYEAVYRNGVLLSRTNDYTATDGTTVTLIDATITGDIIEIFANQTIPLSDTYSQTVSDGKFINNTLTTTTGDIIYASGANTPARLAIGTSADVLTVSGGIPAWAAPAAGGGMTLLATTTLSGGTTTISGISQSYKDLLLILRGFGSNGSKMQIRINGITTSTYYGNSEEIDSGSPAGASTWRTAQTGMEYRADLNNDTNNTGYLRIYDYAGTSAAMKFMETKIYDQPGNRYLNMNFVNYDVVSTGVTSITFLSPTGSIFGTVLTYGVS